MLGRRQFSLAYLMVLLTVAAVGTAVIRLAMAQGEKLLFWPELALFLFVPSLFLALAIATTVHALRVTLYWSQTSATLVRYSIRRHEGQPFYHPVVRFRTADGRQVLTISNSGWWRRSWPIGVALPVRYSLQNPRWIEIVLPSNLWGFSIPLFLFGVLAILALVMLVPAIAVRGLFH